MASKYDGRSGHKWRETRKRVLRRGKERGTPCYRCGKPIDYSLRKPHKMAPTVEHKIPRSKLPAKDRGAEWNLTVSHAHCNYSFRDGRGKKPAVSVEVVQTGDWPD